MKIERISENQLKLTLTKADLVERNIQLEDLISPSEKTQRLFHDIMEQTLEEYDFISDNTPVMVEAVPAGLEGIMIIITKVNPDNKEKHVGISGSDIISQARENRNWKKKPLDIPDENAIESNEILIYSLSSLDDASKASAHLSDVYQGESSLYKNLDRYFLILQIDTYIEDYNVEQLQLILEEYGQKHVSTALSKFYLLEHGEVIIAKDAVQILTKTFCA